MTTLIQIPLRLSFKPWKNEDEGEKCDSIKCSDPNCSACLEIVASLECCNLESSSISSNTKVEEQKIELVNSISKIDEKSDHTDECNMLPTNSK
ncbi:hypothetical protein KI387_010398, partial [Taxus chinensis]